MNLERNREHPTNLRHNSNQKRVPQLVGQTRDFFRRWNDLKTDHSTNFEQTTIYILNLSHNPWHDFTQAICRTACATISRSIVAPRKSGIRMNLENPKGVN